MAAKTDTVILWRPANIQLKNVKVKSAGSYFNCSHVAESKAVYQAGGSEIACHILSSLSRLFAFWWDDHHVNFHKSYTGSARDM